MEHPILTITIPLPTYCGDNPIKLLEDLEKCITHFHFDVQPRLGVSFDPLCLPLAKGAISAFCEAITTALVQPYIQECREANPNFSESDPRYLAGLKIGAGLFSQFGPVVGMTYRMNPSDPTS